MDSTDSTFDPSSIVDGIFTLLGKKVDAQAAATKAASTWTNLDPRYGVDQNGRPYLLGAATPLTPSALTISPTIIVIGIVAATAIVFALKR